jgi:hypothetical protein
MKAVTLTRIGQSGMYALPDGINFANVKDLFINGSQVKFGKFEVSKGGKKVNLCDSDIANPDETVTAIMD